MNEKKNKKTFNTSLFFLFPILDFLKLEPQFASLCFKICQVLKERLEISAVKKNSGLNGRFEQLFFYPELICFWINVSSGVVGFVSLRDIVLLVNTTLLTIHLLSKCGLLPKQVLSNQKGEVTCVVTFFSHCFASLFAHQSGHSFYLALEGCNRKNFNQF